MRGFSASTAANAGAENPMLCVRATVCSKVVCPDCTQLFIRSPLLSCYAHTNCASHSFAFLSSVKDFMGMAGGLMLNKIFIINFESPGLETIAIAE
jgi:hypothetical protein